MYSCAVHAGGEVVVFTANAGTPGDVEAGLLSMVLSDARTIWADQGSQFISRDMDLRAYRNGVPLERDEVRLNRLPAFRVC